jgi:sirohydrochlorin cobaltochelatase
MTITAEDREAFDTLEVRLKAILPEAYQESYEDVQPVSMGSAGLKYGFDGKVAWDQIWGSFCDLAMAGGPPHKGTLLEPARRSAIDAQPDQYREVVEEICRGVTLVTELEARPSPNPGWVRVTTHDDTMAGWLLRAIVMENVAARAEGPLLDLPASPAFRLAKEIKNVITVIAKTCHYWTGHMPWAQQRTIAALFATLAEESPLIEPAFPFAEGPFADGTVADGPTVIDRKSKQKISEADDVDGAARSDAARLDFPLPQGLRFSNHRYAGWLGVECPGVPAALWMMRMMVAANILARREGAVLFVPVNPVTDPGGEIVAGAIARVHHLAKVKQAI